MENGSALSLRPLQRVKSKKKHRIYINRINCSKDSTVIPEKTLPVNLVRIALTVPRKKSHTKSARRRCTPLCTQETSWKARCARAGGAAQNTIQLREPTSSHLGDHGALRLRDAMWANCRPSQSGQQCPAALQRQPATLGNNARPPLLECQAHLPLC